VPTTPPRIRIVVDDRERSPGVLAALRTFESVQLRVARLDIGDYAVGPNLLVERKAVSDFVQSVIDGRLFRQARRLSRWSSGLRFFVLEGTDRDLRQGGFSQHAVHGALITLNLVFGLPVLRTLDPVETAQLLVIAGRQLHRRMTSPTRLHPSVNAPARSTQIRMLLAIRDIGPLRASALLEHFGSMRSLSSATLDELVAVPGIGLKTARAVHWALRCNPCRNTDCSRE
jgi:DNA excision repair protein ERCC-4